jgi:hypothetical protein
MPQALAAVATFLASPAGAATIGAVGSGLEVAKGAFGGGDGGPKPTPGPTPDQIAADKAKQDQTQAALVSQQIPGISAATSGFTSPQYLQSMGLLESGVGGNRNAAQIALNQFLGQNQGGGSTPLENAFQPVGTGGGGGSNIGSDGLSDMLRKWGLSG